MRERARGQGTWRLFVILLSIASLGCGPSSPTQGESLTHESPRRSEADAPIEATIDESNPEEPAITSPAAPSAEIPGRAMDARSATWSRLFAHLAARCYVDELARTEYTTSWLNYGQPREAVARGALYPSATNQLFPKAGSAAAERRAEALRSAWLEEPRSRVADCHFSAKRRDCPTCASSTPHTVVKAHYVVYLPAALFREPERVRALLILVPGGNGERSRAFLTPIPGKGIHDKGSGGFETKRQVDEYLNAHPSAAASIVVSLQTAGGESVNGATEHLTRDVPRHIADVFLGGADPAELVVGVEGVSSGARAVVRALYAKPDAFHTVGLSCMACGGVDPRTARLAPRPKLMEWSRVLSERSAAGSLRVRFAIGSRDNQHSCNKALYDMWAAAGLFNASITPELVDCDPEKPRDAGSCDSEWDGFRLYRGELHDYRFLARSFPDQLVWHLASLTEIQARRR